MSHASTQKKEAKQQQKRSKSCSRKGQFTCTQTWFFFLLSSHTCYTSRRQKTMHTVMVLIVSFEKCVLIILCSSKKLKPLSVTFLKNCPSGSRTSFVSYAAAKIYPQVLSPYCRSCVQRMHYFYLPKHCCNRCVGRFRGHFTSVDGKWPVSSCRDSPGSICHQ